MKKFKILMCRSPISTSLSRLEIHPSLDEKSDLKVVERIEVNIFKEIPVEFTLVVYGIMSMEITCISASYCDEIKLLIISFKESLQIFKFSNDGHIKYSKVIKLPFESYDAFNIISDTLVFTKESKIVLFNKIQIK